MAERRELWQRLLAHGLVTGEAPAPSDGEADPWVNKILLGVSGWLGALFIITAVQALALLMSEGSSAVPMVIGTLLCLLAGGILRGEEAPLALEQAAFAASLAGQISILAGLWQAGADLRETALAALALGAALFAAVPVFVHRVWAAGLAAVGLMLAFPQGLAARHLGPLAVTGAAAAVWLTELNDARTAAAKAAAGYGFLLAVALPLIVVGLGQWEWSPSRLLSPDPAPAGLGIFPGFALLVLGVGLAVLRGTARRPLASAEGRLVAAGILLAGLLALFAPGVAPFLLAVLVGFAHGSRVLTGFGVALLMLYLGRFYYDLHLTLLAKSGLLVAVGAGLLAVRVLLRSAERTPEREAEDA